jgi:hypothetical protein
MRETKRRFPVTHDLASDELKEVWDALGAPHRPIVPSDPGALFDTDRAVLRSFLERESDVIPWDLLQNLATDLRYVALDRQVLGLLLSQCLGCYRAALHDHGARRFLSELYLSLFAKRADFGELFGTSTVARVFRFFAHTLGDELESEAPLAPSALDFVPHFVSLGADSTAFVREFLDRWLAMNTPGAALRFLVYTSRVVCADGSHPLFGDARWSGPEPWESFGCCEDLVWNEDSVKVLLSALAPQALTHSIRHAARAVGQHEQRELIDLFVAELSSRVAQGLAGRTRDLRDNLLGSGPRVWRDAYGMI